MVTTSRSLRRNTVVGLLAVVAAGAGFALSAAPAQAASINRYVAVTGSDVFVNVANDCTDPDLPCRTVVHAIVEAAAGDTINIGAGTWDQNFSVSKSLTFLGSGSTGTGKTVLDGAAVDTPTVQIAGSDSAIAVTFQNIAVDGNADSVGILAAGAVTLTVTGASVSGNGFSGEGSEASGIYIDSDVQLDVTDSTISANAGYGIFAENNAAVSLTNTTVSGNGDDGVHVVSATAATTISGSTIDGNGDGSPSEGASSG